MGRTPQPADWARFAAAVDAAPTRAERLRDLERERAEAELVRLEAEQAEADRLSREAGRRWRARHR